MATNGRAKINATNLAAIGRGRDLSAGVRIMPVDQGPSLQVIMDRRYMITPAYIQQHIGKFDPDQITFEQMRLMRRHPMIAFALHFLKAVLLNAEWHIECADPKIAAFNAWLMKTHPELSGLGGGAKRAQMLPQLQAEFDPIWMKLQTSKAGAPAAATSIPPMAPPPGAPLPLSGGR